MAGLRDAPLAERDHELAVFQESIEAVAAGASRLVMLEGPAGIGKTRLLAAVRERSSAAGLQTLAARGSELERSFAFGAVRQLFDPALAALDDEARARALAGQAQAAARPLALTTRAQRVGEDLMSAALNGLFWLCANLAQRGPLLLAIDDIDWCDEASLRWAAFAAARLHDIPVLIALSRRLDQPAAAPALIAELARVESAQTLTLRSLTATAVASLVAHALGTAPAPTFAQACEEATGGNPFLLHELLLQIDSQRIEPTEASVPRIAGLGSSRVADNVLARLERLGEPATWLTRALAVLEDRVELSVAAALSGLDEEPAADAAAALTDVGVLSEGFPLSFVHPLVRSAIYEHLPYAERLAAHGQAARLLAPKARPEVAAAHLLIARPTADPWVVELLRRAASDASVQGCSAVAVSYLRRALAEPPPESTRGEVLGELGLAEHNANEPAAIEHLSQALELANSPADRATLGLVLARAIWHAGKISEAVSLLSFLLDRLDDELAAPLEAELIAIARLDPQTRAVGLRRLARQNLDRTHHDPTRRLLLANLAFERAVSGHEPAAAVAALAERALSDGRLLADQGSENTIYYLAAWVLGQCDRFEQAEDALQAGLALAREEGSIVGYARALTFRTNLCYRRGLLSEAHADAAEALDHLTPIRGPLVVAFLLDVLLEGDELQNAQDTLERYQLDDEIPNSILHTIVLERRGRLRLAQGRRDDALHDLLVCRQRSIEWGALSPAFLAWRSSTAVALAHLDRIDEATGLAAAEVEHAHAFGAPRALGIALHAQAPLARGPHRLFMLQQAALILQGSGATLEHAHALVDLGASLRATGQRTAAREKLRAALELAEHCAATALARRARTELRSAGGRPTLARDGGLASLSPAELRVATMAATGMSNRDIAQALFVTPKTVEWHLSQVYRKLHLHSRTELPAALDHPDHNDPPRALPLTPAG